MSGQMVESVGKEINIFFIAGDDDSVQDVLLNLALNMHLLLEPFRPPE
jgi:hypothetical protein